MGRKFKIYGLIMLMAANQMLVAGTILQFDIRGNDRHHKQTAYIADGRVAFNRLYRLPDTDLIFDYQADQFLLVSHKEKSYRVLDANSLDSFNEQLTNMRLALAQVLTPQQQGQLTQQLNKIGLGRSERPVSAARLS